MTFLPKFGFLFATVAEIFSKQLVLSRRYADLEVLHFVTELAPESGAYWVKTHLHPAGPRGFDVTVGLTTSFYAPWYVSSAESNN